ncbi:TonB-dependent receptor [Novosphingobium fluoreni]|uniref:TonB-dependent receptor n=1 Tax=Novosphingobium fluoreni TaxID=1391222 RepID=UPI000AB1EC9B
MTFKCKHLVTVSAVSLSMVAFIVPAIAQDAATSDTSASDSQLADIVVTARKFGESAQSLPIAVAAFSGAELQNRVVLNVQDLQTVTPGLTISNSSTGGSPVFAIRGTATELGIDGGVAVYQNDVPVISTFGIVNAFYDISAIEVLKGPQGTQFGTNTTGGTITVRTNLPTKNFEGYIKAGYGNYNRRELEGMINLPVNDVLAFRFAGNYVKRDGYVRNLAAADGIPNRFSNEDHYSLRGTMSLDSGPIRSDLIIDYYNRDEAPTAQVPLALFPSAGGVDLAKFGARTGTRKTIYVGPDLSGVRKPFIGRAKLFGLEHLLQMELSDNLSIRNVLGFRHDSLLTSEESSGTTITQVHTRNVTTTDQWTDDITLQYKGMDGRLRANLGGYFSMLNRDQGLNSPVVQGTFLTLLQLPLVANLNSYEQKDTNSKAVYSNADFDLTDSLNISGGVRYNWDRVSSIVTQSQGIGLPDFGERFFLAPDRVCNFPALAGYVDKDLTTCFGRRSAKFKAPSWNVTVSNKFGPGVLGYAKVSHGYLAGGTNFTIREVPFYNPEKTTMFEGGLKADWRAAGRPIRTNIALYYGRTSNKQVFYNYNYDDGGAGFGVFNAAKLEVYGLDFEMRYSPFEGFTLDGSYNYIHSKFKEFGFPAVGGNGDGKTGTTLVPPVDLSGATPAQTPKHQFNIAASYDLPLDENVGKVTATVSGYYTSKITQTNVFTPYNASFGADFNVIKSYFLANASLNWKNALGSPVSGQLWIRNIFDRNYLTARSTQFQAFGYATGIFGAPRTYGGSLTVTF